MPKPILSRSSRWIAAAAAAVIGFSALVVAYDPHGDPATPSEQVGWYEVVQGDDWNAIADKIIGTDKTFAEELLFIAAMADWNGMLTTDPLEPGRGLEYNVEDIPPPTTTTTTTTTTTLPPTTTTTTTIPPTTTTTSTTTTTLPPEDYVFEDHVHPAPLPEFIEPSGNFRTICEFSHLSYDDPIVYPGQPGASHLHMFFGNEDADAFSTYESLKNYGDSTCDGGPLNRTGYWIPAVLDGTGDVVIPHVVVVYYKTFHHMSQTQVFPEGLRFIAGYNAATGTGGAGWKCSDNSGSGNTIPDCPTGTDVIASIGFPPCWDGINLDSSDHRSHMASKVPPPGGGAPVCPSSHPVLLPTITVNVWYHHLGDSENWYLSSDRMSEFPEQWLPDGSTMHSDWFGAWDRTAVELWTENCLQPVDANGNAPNCDNSNLGNGQALNSRPNYTGPERIPVPTP